MFHSTVQQYRVSVRSCEVQQINVSVKGSTPYSKLIAARFHFLKVHKGGKFYIVPLYLLFYAHITVFCVVLSVS